MVIPTETMKVLIFGLCLVFAAAEVARYDNYKVYEVVPKTEDHLKTLHSLEEDNGYSFWTDVVQIDVPVQVMVAPHKLAEFADILDNLKMSSYMRIKNVQENIDNERIPTTRTTAEFGWNAYHTLDEIYSWLESLAGKYPNIVTVVDAGKSYEGRLIKGVKVSFKEGNPGVFLEGGIHAREWISPATVTYILNELLTSKNSEIREIAESNDWYIFPNFNPDGYVYTWTTNRLWRKTRSPSGICKGADPNRNWGYHWMDGGASSFPCTETYAGSSAFSEVETKSMSEYITGIQDKIYAYIAFHSYSQYLLIPYGHSSDHVENYNDLMTIGLNATKVLKSRYGTTYKTGNIVDIIYIASGGSMDWVKGSFGTPITFTYELRDTGSYGFNLPAAQIIPTGEETMDSLVAIIHGANELGYAKRA